MSHPIRLLKEWWPATTCALVLLVLSTLTAPLELEYDDNGLGSLLFLINSVVGFFFLLPVTLSILSMEINGFPITALTLYYLVFRFTFCVICSSVVFPDGSGNGLPHRRRSRARLKA